jgi:protein SCO1/2
MSSMSLLACNSAQNNSSSSANSSFIGVDVTASTAFKAEINTKDVAGKSFNLQKDDKLNGKSIDGTLVTFGFTQCPDYCPTTLSKIMQTQKILGDNKNIRVVFVSIDVDNDKPDVLKDYLTAFNPNYIGISTTKDELEKIKSNFKVTSFKEKNTFNHTTGAYFVDKSGNIRIYMPYTMNAEQMAEDINKLI